MDGVGEKKSVRPLCDLETWNLVLVLVEIKFCVG